MLEAWAEQTDGGLSYRNWANLTPRPDHRSENFPSSLASSGIAARKSFPTAYRPFAKGKRKESPTTHARRRRRRDKMSFVPVNPRPMLQGLVDKEIVVRLKWGETEYKGTLVSLDSYLNIQMSGTKEYMGDKFTGDLGQVLIRCVVP